MPSEMNLSMFGDVNVMNYRLLGWVLLRFAGVWNRRLPRQAKFITRWGFYGGGG